MLGTAENTFLEGMRGDHSPLDTGNRSATDIVNGALLSLKGDQMILQNKRSHSPVEGKMPSDRVLIRTGRVQGFSYPVDSSKTYISLGYSFDYIEPGAETITLQAVLTDGTSREITFPQGNFTPGNEEVFILGIGEVPVMFTVSVGNGRHYDGFIIVNYMSPSLPVQLPEGSQLFGVSVHNNVAYMISGKPTDVQFSKTDANNRAPVIPLDMGSERDDRDSLDNSVTDINVIEYPKFSEKLFYVHETSFFWRTQSAMGRTRTGTTTVYPNLVMAGGYRCDCTIRTSTKYATDVKAHYMKVRFKAGPNYTEWRTVDDRKSSGLTLNFSFDFNLSEGNVPLLVEYEGYFVGSGRVFFEGFLDLEFTKVPRTSVTDEEVIEIDLLESTSAKTKLHDDGSIIVRKKTSGSGTYEVALGYRPFVTVQEGSSHTFFNLPAGEYPVYIKKFIDDRWFIVKSFVSIATSLEINDIILTAIIKKFNGREDFVLEVSFEDPYRFYSDNAANQYEVGYRSVFGEIYTTAYEVVSGLVRKVEFPVSMGSDGALEVSVKTLSPHNEQGVESARYREAHVDVPITQELDLNKYTLEVGTFPSPNYALLQGQMEYVYRPLNNLDGGPFRTNKITLSGKTYLDIEIQPSYDNTVNIIYAEKQKHMRLINSGFAVTGDSGFEIMDRMDNRDPNQYRANNVELATRHVQSVSGVVRASVTAINTSGGMLAVGMYRYYIKLSTSDGNETDFIEETGHVPIFHGDTMGSLRGGRPTSRTERSVEISVSNIDSIYSHLVLYYVINSGEEVSAPLFYRVEKDFIIPEETPGGFASIRLTHTGAEPISLLSEGEFNLTQSYPRSVATIAQVQNRLFTGNVSSNAVDYNKLFKAAERIFAVPTDRFGNFTMTSIYDAWDNLFSREGAGLSGSSSAFFDKKLSVTPIADPNRIGPSDVNRMLQVLNSEGFHNPMSVEKLAGYWPMETYKTGVCFVLDDDTVTHPVPVTSGDFEYLDFADFDSALNILQQSESSGFLENWTKVGTVNVNNIGILRFPKPVNPRSIYYPKFVFKKQRLMEMYPEFFSRAKGFFFVRAERRPDIMTAGHVSQGFMSMSDPFNPDKFDRTVYEDIMDLSGIIEGKSIFPVMVSGIDGWPAEGAVKIHRYLTGSELFDEPGTLLTASGIILRDTPGHVKETKGVKDIYKYIFRTADMFADNPRIAASFNGNAYGLYPVGEFVSVVLEEQADGLVDKQRIQALQYVLNKGMDGYSPESIVKAVFDYVGHGTIARTGGGFSSKHPFKGVKITDEDNVYFPYGVYEHYLGISLPERMNATYAFVYPNSVGPVTPDMLKAMYSFDEATSFVAITPRFSFADFNNVPEIEVVGTRGDCFITQNVMNILHGEETIYGSHASTRELLKNTVTGEWNSFRAKEVGSSLMSTQHSGYLTHLRHPLVTDAVLAAKFGRAPGFFPFDGAGTGMLVPGRDDKMATTMGFNKGYAAHFTGRKYISISRNSPYVVSANENTLQFSELFLSGSFFNGYRSFETSNRRDYNRELGPITKLMNVNDNLLSVHTRGITLIGVNDQAVVATEQGLDMRLSSLYVVSEKASVISSEFGSSWLGSIKKTDNAVYGVDVNRHLIWSTNGKGPLQIISRGAVNKILAVFLSGFQGRTEVPGELYIRTHYNTVSNDVEFTFYNKQSKVTRRTFEMDPDMYDFLFSLGDVGLNGWVTEGISDDDRLKRREYVDRFRQVVSTEIMDHLTLVYNEDTRIWTSRLSYSPEFAFNVDNKYYSVNNLTESMKFGERKSVADTTKNCHVIWEHERAHRDIAAHGSFFGAEPVFEVEYVVNKDIKYEKIFKAIHVVGNEAVPSRVVYLVSPTAPWLKGLINTHADGYADWDEMKSAFYTRTMDSSVAVVHPTHYVEQDIHDRRYNSIMRANFLYQKGYGEIRIGKNLRTMYAFGPAGAERKKHYINLIRDNWVKIRIEYNTGRPIQIKAITTDYQITF